MHSDSFLEWSWFTSSGLQSWLCVLDGSCLWEWDSPLQRFRHFTSWRNVLLLFFTRTSVAARRRTTECESRDTGFWLHAHRRALTDWWKRRAVSFLFLKRHLDCLIHLKRAGASSSEQDVRVLYEELDGRGPSANRRWLFSRVTESKNPPWDTIALRLL